MISTADAGAQDRARPDSPPADPCAAAAPTPPAVPPGLTVAEALGTKGPPEPPSGPDDDPPDGGLPALPPPEPDHPLTDPAAAASVVREATAPDPEVIAQATNWAAAHAAGPGLYLDRNPPAEPSVVVRETITRTRVTRSLTVIQSGRDCERAAEAISSGGPPATAYPVRNPDSCKNLAEVRKAEALGLAPTASVCPSCPHNTALLRKAGITAAVYAAAQAAMPALMAGDPDDDWWPSAPAPADTPAPATPPADEPPPPAAPGPADDLVPQCPHLAALDAVRQAPHRVATSSRAALDIIDLAGESGIVFLVDNAEDVLAPIAETKVLRRRDIDRLAAAADEAARRAARDRRPTEWWEGLADAARSVADALVAGVRAEVPLPAPAARAKLWATTLWSILRDAGVERLPGELVRVLAAAASGDLRTLVLVPGDPVPGGPVGHLRAVWHPRVPDATVVAVGGTIARPVGRAVTDITGAAPPGWTAGAVQIPERLTGGSRAGSVASRIRGHLAARPGERLAVVLPGNRRHSDALRREVEALLVPAELNRVAFAWWYERGLPECDRVVALGVPAVPGRSVARRLEQRGQVEALLAGGDWGDVVWVGAGADGQAWPPVACRGYRHAEWGTAYQDAVADLLRRKLAGVRVPVELVADADLGLGLPLAAGPRPIDRDELRLLECLRDAVRAGGGPVTLTSGRSKRKKKRTLRAGLSVSTPRLAELAGVPASTVRRVMGDLAADGLAVRAGQRGGWSWPGPVAYPDYGPGQGTDAIPSRPVAYPDYGPGQGTDAIPSTPVASAGGSGALAVADPGTEPGDAGADDRDAAATTPAVAPETAPAETEPPAPADPDSPRWDPETHRLVQWFSIWDWTLPDAPFRLPRPGRPGGFVTASDPPAVYARLREDIAEGPAGAPARSGRLARNLRELYAVFGPRPETEATSGAAA